MPLTKIVLFKVTFQYLILLVKQKSAKYLLVGLIGALLETSLFTFLLNLSVGIILSNMVAFHLAFISCYFLHYYFTHLKPFDSKLAVMNGLWRYATLMYGQLLFGTFLLWIMIENMNINTYSAKILQIVIVAPGSYLVQKELIFNRRLQK